MTNILLGELASGNISIIKTMPALISGVITAVNSVFMPRVARKYASDDTNTVIKEIQMSQEIMGTIVTPIIIVLIIFGYDFFSLWVPGNDIKLLTILSGLDISRIKVGRIIFMMLSLILCVFIVNGKEFIILWAGNDNSQAYVVATILMAAYIFILTESIGTQILWAMNQHKEQSILKIVIVILNIALTALLISWNPLIGATIGTFISLILGDVVVMNVIFKKKLDINLKFYYYGIFKGIVPCLVIAFIVGIIFKIFMPVGWVWLCVKISIMMLVYGVLLIKFGMNTYEKNIVCSVLKKIKAVGGK